MTTPTPLSEPHTIVFTTETGSCYRVDTRAQTIERLIGVGPPTLRVGAGARRYASIGAIGTGLPVLIMWGEHTKHKAVEGAMPATVTSCVVSIGGRDD